MAGSVRRLHHPLALHVRRRHELRRRDERQVSDEARQREGLPADARGEVARQVGLRERHGAAAAARRGVGEELRVRELDFPGCGDHHGAAGALRRGVVAENRAAGQLQDSPWRREVDRAAAVGARCGVVSERGSGEGNERGVVGGVDRAAAWRAVGEEAASRERQHALVAPWQEAAGVVSVIGEACGRIDGYPRTGAGREPHASARGISRVL